MSDKEVLDYFVLAAFLVIVAIVEVKSGWSLAIAVFAIGLTIRYVSLNLYFPRRSKDD